MLVIGKPAQFGSNNMPVRGQCQPHTQGWQLRIVRQGEEEAVFSGSYYACRQLQLECMGLEDDQVREKVQMFLANPEAGSEETQRIRVNDPDATPYDVPPLSPASSETPSLDGESTRVIPRDEMPDDDGIRKRRKEFDE